MQGQRLSARKRVVVGAAVAAVGLAVAGCSSDTPAAQPVSSASSAAPSVGSASASPNPTLSAADQEAFEQAVATALAYRQTLADLYSGARTDLNDLTLVAQGRLLDRSLESVSKGLVAGYKSEPQGVEVTLVSAEPVRVQLDRRVPQVVLTACIDKTAITDVAPDGTRTQGVRERVNYQVTKTTHLPAPGWAVSKLTAEADPKAREC